MRVRVNFTGQSKATVPNVTIESEDGIIDKETSDKVLAEAQRVYDNASAYCITKMR